MQQKELIEKLAQKAGMEKATTERMLKKLACIAVAALSAGEDVPLPGIGKLVVEDRAARVGHNPITGETISIPAKRVLRLRPKYAVKDALA